MTLSFDGTNYEIDLNDTNAENVTTALEPFINARVRDMSQATVKERFARPARKSA